MRTYDRMLSLTTASSFASACALEIPRRSVSQGSCQALRTRSRARARVNDDDNNNNDTDGDDDGADKDRDDARESTHLFEPTRAVTATQAW